MTLSPTAARRFLVHTFALNGFQTLPDVAAAVDRLQFVQEDSINVCGRIHDLILWARVREYAPSLLHDLLYGERRGAFEYDFPNLCVLPLGDYPYFVRAMRERAASTHGWHSLSEEEREVADWVLARLDEEGPLRTRATGSAHGHVRSAWGTQTTRAARVMERLWRHGTLTIARRDNFERSFDRTARLLPELAGLHEPEADLPADEEAAAYLTRKRLRARRLFRLRPHDKKLLGEAAFVSVTVEGISRPWYALAEDADALANAENLPVSDDVIFLAPLDPLVYDRERTRLLFGFEYMWEVYTSEAKRRWGYYVLPILRGARLIGRIDPKIDRKTRTLTLHRLSLEPGVEAAADESLAVALAGRLSEYARFLGAERIRLPERTEPEQLAAMIRPFLTAEGVELTK